MSGVPRKTAWAVLLGGVIWFGTTSPKTPLQFFDAANRDESVVDARLERRFDQIRPKRAQAVQTLNKLDREMNRMALSYDIIRDPSRVQKERSSILLGFYDASPQTREAMMQNNSSYRSAAEQFEKIKMDLKASQDSKSASSAIEYPQQEHKELPMKRFQVEMNRMLLRQFQAKLFWRKQK